MTRSQSTRSNISVAVRRSERNYYTVSEAAEVLGVSPSTIWRWIDAGRLPAYRVGLRSIRIKKEDLGLSAAPARPTRATIQPHIRELWAGYDPAKAREAIAAMAGSWSDLDTDEIIAQVHRRREEGTRREERP